MQNIEEYIDNIAEKFGYDEELSNQLKRIVPVMIQDKPEDIQNLLYDTLNRVKIFVMEKDPTAEDVERCKQEIMGKDNKDVTFVEEDRGEYDNRGVAAGAYVNEPVFDEDMNITGRNSFIYTTKLSEYDKLKDVYGTRINISHLIHELGHAWASEKGEFVQDKDGNYITTCGAYTNSVKIDKEKREVETDSYSGLMLEESLNTIEEENTLCNVLGIESIKELRGKGYVPSNYQGLMTDIMRSYVEKFGKERFNNFRFLKDKEGLKEIETAIKDTEAWQTLQQEEYTEGKKAKFDKINELETTEGAKNLINKIVREYSEDFFPDNTKFSPMEKLENVFTQVYNFSNAKYNFGILGNEHNADIYKEVMTSIVQEGYVLKNQAKELPSKEEHSKDDFMSSLKSEVKSDEEVRKEYKKESAEKRNIQRDIEKEI